MSNKLAKSSIPAQVQPRRPRIGIGAVRRKPTAWMTSEFAARTWSLARRHVQGGWLSEACGRARLWHEAILGVGLLELEVAGAGERGLHDLESQRHAHDGQGVVFGRHGLGRRARGNCASEGPVLAPQTLDLLTQVLGLLPRVRVAGMLLQRRDDFGVNRLQQNVAAILRPGEARVPLLVAHRAVVLQLEDSRACGKVPAATCELGGIGLHATAADLHIPQHDVFGDHSPAILNNLNHNPVLVPIPVQLKRLAREVAAANDVLLHPRDLRPAFHGLRRHLEVEAAQLADVVRPQQGDPQRVRGHGSHVIRRDGSVHPRATPTTTEPIEETQLDLEYQLQRSKGLCLFMFELLLDVAVSACAPEQEQQQHNCGHPRSDLERRLRDALRLAYEDVGCRRISTDCRRGV
mmetsp:Transcript_45433/g.117992  ORF Transcript_45433/g.117992 Transcript_45433/m.117992 type:complete len:406 (+) Transcript_45433:2-1219(+)